MNYKYKIGQTLVLSGCSRKYQLSNKIVVRHRHVSKTMVILNGQNVVLSHLSYSDNHAALYPESTLTTT